MPDVEEHVVECEAFLGQGWRKVHEWLDAFITVDRAKKHEKRHHQRKGIEEIRVRWGDEAVLAAAVHVRRDIHGYLLDDREEWGVKVGY